MSYDDCKYVAAEEVFAPVSPAFEMTSTPILNINARNTLRRTLQVQIQATECIRKQAS